MRTLLALALALVSTSLAAESDVRHQFQSSAPAGTSRRVVVAIPAGEITVRNGTPGVISISGFATRQPDGPRSRAEQQRIVNDISAEVYVGTSDAVIRRKFGPNAQGFSADKFTAFDVTIEVPAGMAVMMETKFGEVRLEGTFGDVDVDLRAGEIDAIIPRATVRELLASCRVGEVTTNLGDEIIKKEGVFPGKTRYVNPNGTATITLHTTAGEVDVTLTK